MSSIYSIWSHILKALGTCSCLLFSSILALDCQRNTGLICYTSLRTYTLMNRINHTRGVPRPCMNQVPAYATKRPTLPAEVMLGFRLPIVTKLIVSD